MRKMSIVRFAASAALLGSVGLAVALPGGVAAASGPKPPLTASCSLLLGNATDQLVSGCAATSGAPKLTPDGVAIPNAGDTGATITWMNKKNVTESFTYASVANTCSTYGGATASLEESETATITGGNSKFTLQTEPASDVCIYIDGVNGTILVVGNNVPL
jgi:hypothetical protein